MNLNEEAMMNQQQPEGTAPKKPEQVDQKQTQQEVSPEIQEQLDIFISNGMSIIHNPQVSDGILSKILKSKNKIEAIAEAIVLIINRLFDSASQNNQTLANETLIFGSNFLLGELITLAETAGMQKLTDEQKTEALQRGVGMFIDDAVKNKRISKDQLIDMGNQVKQTQEGQKIMQQGGLQ